MASSCEQCGIPYERKRRDHRFCTLACATRWRRGENARQRQEKLEEIALITEKVCKACRKRKPIEEFHRASGNADGRVPKCRDCVRPGHKRGTFRCSGHTSAGRRCRGEAGPNGLCAVHAVYGDRWKRFRIEHVLLRDTVVAFAAKGLGAYAIAGAMGVGPQAIRACLVRAGFDSSAGDNGPDARQRARKLWLDQQHAEEKERAEWREDGRRLAKQWKLPTVPSERLSDEEREELDALIAEQATEKSRRMIYRPPNWLNLDQPLHGEDTVDEYDLIWMVPMEVSGDGVTAEDQIAHVMGANGADAAAVLAKRRHRKRLAAVVS